MNISFGRGIACLLVCALGAPPAALAQAPVAAPSPYTAPAAKMRGGGMGHEGGHGGGGHR